MYESEQYCNQASSGANMPSLLHSITSASYWSLGVGASARRESHTSVLLALLSASQEPAQKNLKNTPSYKHDSSSKQPQLDTAAGSTAHLKPEPRYMP
jgi:hypothetical protein